MLFLALFFYNAAFLALFAEDRPSMTFVLEAWMKVEGAFDAYISGEEPGEALSPALEQFREKLDAYTASPLFDQYVGSTLFPEEEKHRMDTLIGIFEKALTEGSTASAAASDAKAAAEIRALLVSWQGFDAGVSNTVFVRTYSLFGAFILIITLLVYILYLFQRALRRSRIQEKNTAAYSRAVMLAHEEERTRIGVEIHDTVLQDLGRLMHLTEECTTGGTSGGAALLSMEARLMQTLRSVCLEIMPPDFSRLALEDSLYALCMDFEKRTGVPCRAAIPEGIMVEGLKPEMQLQCFRLVQEALSNIEKHAHAREASLTLRNGQKGEKQTLIIFVSDDGAGMDENRRGKNSLGIRGMYERIAMLGGEISFLSESGQGLTVRIEIPLGEP
ncbi:hypothetical protein AGMMS50293_03070 [Spirochaetia bacterium]|nr:hypothetical protein AGMMS50293_03070 [Spirochaetia bacterium]